jgi:hypothetical protein
MPAARRHVVLIPGFAGFDALGQLEYYSGVSPLFHERGGAVLHYFDNFPTASVECRAERLASYLVKRFARGEIQDGDTISLVGHSTGGLDIRRLVLDLDRGRTAVVDGGSRVDPGAILRALRRVVFLSVPHWGTNIADWVRSHKVWRQIVVTKLRLALAGAQAPVLDRIGAGVTGVAARFTRSGLFRAVGDSLREADPQCGGRGPGRLAEAHEAASEIELYLRHIASDFRAIDDLTAAPAADTARSPAHFTPAEREREERLWRKLRIDVHSYATLGPRAWDFATGAPAPVWLLSNPLETADLARPRRGMDVVYRVCYRACAGGPFVPPPRAPWPVETWDNDGIVNTASMWFPVGGTTLLENADHMDVVGHFAAIRGPAGGARVWRAYDLLGSGSRFDSARFTALWREIFDWAATGAISAAA